MRKKSNITKSLNAMDEKDVYSLMLFILFCMKNVPEYAVLSELVFAVDRENLMNLLSIFGGTTIRIPTVHEMNVILSGMIAYTMCTFDGADLSDAVKEAKRPDVTTKEIMEVYETVSEVMKNYDFELR